MPSTHNDPHELTDLEEDEPTLDSPAMIAWVEGTARIPPWSTDGRVALDTIRKHAAVIGLHVFVQVDKNEDGAEQAPRRRRWTSKRVHFDQVADLVSSYPGIRVEDAAEQLYRFEPWTTAAKGQALSRLRVAMHHLGPSRIVRRYDRDGTTRLYTPLAVPGAPAAPVRPLDLPLELPYDVVAAGALCLTRHLRNFERSDQNLDGILATDSRWVEDVVIDIVKAVVQKREVGLDPTAPGAVR